MVINDWLYTNFQFLGSNKKERRRTQSINNAFASLRDCIPNVPCDTKLSKIKTLRLATSYIDYLMQMLNSENVISSNAISGFKADIHKRWKEKSEEQKRRELVRYYYSTTHWGKNPIFVLKFNLDKNVILCHFIAIFCAKIQMFYFLKDSFLTWKSKIGILSQCVVSLFYYHEPHFSVVTYEKSLYKSCESKTQANKIKQMCQYNKVENVLQ